MKKKINRSMALVITGMFFTFLSCGGDKISNQSMYKNLDLQGHRGARGLKPENTAPAFIEAMKYKMTTLELDTNLTKDNQLIVHHDSQTNPEICCTENGKKIKSTAIHLMTVDQLKKLDCGSLKNKNFKKQVPVPGTKLITLKEFFSFIKKQEKEYNYKPLFNIELKYPEKATKAHMEKAAEIMVKTIENAGMTKRTTVQSFKTEILPYVKKLNPALKTSALYSTGYAKGFFMHILGFSMGRLNHVKDAHEKGADIISPHYSYISATFVREAHKRNMAVIPWTVNSEKEMKRLVSLGVDGIISDYPDMLRQVFDKKQ